MEAKKRAEPAFCEVTKNLNVPFTPASTLKKMQREYGGQLIISVTSLFPLKLVGIVEAMLVELTQVTRDNLRDVAGSLWALWATAQQINAHQKVELSIRCVFTTINVHWNYNTGPIC